MFKNFDSQITEDDISDLLYKSSFSAVVFGNAPLSLDMIEERIRGLLSMFKTIDDTFHPGSLWRMIIHSDTFTRYLIHFSGPWSVYKIGVRLHELRSALHALDNSFSVTTLMKLMKVDPFIIGVFSNKSIIQIVELLTTALTSFRDNIDVNYTYEQLWSLMCTQSKFSKILFKKGRDVTKFPFTYMDMARRIWERPLRTAQKVRTAQDHSFLSRCHTSVFF